MKKKSVAVIGAAGRMGQEIGRLLLDSKLLKPALGVLRSGEAPVYAKTTKKITVDSLSEIDVIIDFSSVDSFNSYLKLAEKSGKPLVTGVTGISAEQKKQLAKVAKKIPVLWAPNMSLGVAALTDALSSLSSLKNFDFQIEEIHHNKKKDKPSGTALHLQAELERSVGKKCPEPVAIRGGGVFGVHKVYAMSDDEVIVFEHSALNRKVFASGAVRAAEWLINKKPGLYDMKDVLR